MENESIKETKKALNSIINVLDNRNSEDGERMLDFGMSHDFYDGMIRGREEAIRLIKKAFQL